MYKTVLEVEGMMCGHCEAHVNETVRNAFSVKKVTSSHSKGQTEIISDAPLDEEKLRSAIDETGYTVKSVKTEEFSKKGIFSK